MQSRKPYYRFPALCRFEYRHNGNTALLLFFQQGFPFVQHFVEMPLEQGEGSGSGNKIGNRFGQKYRKYFICEKVRQNVNEGDQQNDFPEQGQEKGNFCLADGDEGLLAGQLDSHHETGGEINP